MSGFMAVNFKEYSRFKPEAIQTLQNARREAHLFDISREVSDEIQSLVNKKSWELNRKLLFPTPTGYLRFNFDLSKIVLVDHLGKGGNEEYYDKTKHYIVSGMVWHHGYLYFCHDVPGQHVGILPIRCALEYDPTDSMTPSDIWIGDSQDNKPFCRLTMDCISDRDLTAKDAAQLGRAIRDFLVIAVVALDMIAEPKATVIERTAEPYAFANKNKQFFERTSLVKVHLRRCRSKYLRELAEPTGRHIGWHQPIQHFVHYRVTDPDCQHNWIPRLIEDDGKRYKCSVCGEWKTLRVLPNGRGDPNIGIIHTHHEVVK